MTDPNQPNNAHFEPIIQITPVPQPENEKYKITPTPALDSPTGVYIPADIADAIAENRENAAPGAD